MDGRKRKMQKLKLPEGPRDLAGGRAVVDGSNWQQKRGEKEGVCRKEMNVATFMPEM